MSSYVLITGASKGIGKALAYQLAEMKYNLLLIARSEVELKELSGYLFMQHGIKVFFLSIDLSGQDASKKIYDWCIEKKFNVVALINNAGYGCFGNFESLSLEDQLMMVRVNAHVGVELTHMFIPLLKKNKKAYIMNVCSTSGYQAVPKMILYAASKAFMISFTRGLRYELKESGISVTCLSPGPVKTNFIERAGMNEVKARVAKFEMTPNVVARTALNAMFKGKSEVVPGFLNVLSVLASRYLPKSMLEKIVARIYNIKPSNIESRN